MRFVESWPNFGQLMKLALVLVVIGLVAFAAAADQNAEWLANKSKEEGVVTLPSGLMYKVRVPRLLLYLPWCVACFTVL